MPTYEYKCAACEHEWEAEQSIKDDPIKTCPSCHADSAKRQISLGAGFILKGGGWYSDLYSSSKGGDGSKDKPEATAKKQDAKAGDAPATGSSSSGSGSSGSGSSGSGSSGSGSSGSGSSGSGSSGSSGAASGSGSSGSGSSGSGSSGGSGKQASAA